MMKHVKTYHSIVRQSEDGPITIEGPLPSSELKKYKFHKDLIAFRPAEKQFEAVLKIADFPEGRIIIARTEDTIIGYVTYLYPDPLERWSEFEMEDLLVLGAIEVIPEYRGVKIAFRQLETSMHDTFIEYHIIILTEYFYL